eukprot:12883626-Prorocentrum_lima.AAC.1
MLYNLEVPALLGLGTIEGKNGIIDTRAGQCMYVCDNPAGIEIRVCLGAVSARKIGESTLRAFAFTMH